MKFKLLFLIVAIFICSSCNRKTEIKGEVFVVTAGSGNYKLGLVEVRAFPEDVITKFLEAKKPEYEAAKKTIDDEKAFCEANNQFFCFTKWLKSQDDLRSMSFDDRSMNWAASGQTDSDGKFQLTLSKPGRYVLMATAKRAVGDEDERYYWSVWINADGNVQSVTLSNNNLLADPSPDRILSMR